jgi:nitroreductase
MMQHFTLGESHMNVFDIIQARKSTRGYESKPVPNDTIDKLLEAARVAPSASNVQPWHFILVTDKEKREKLSAGPYAKFLTESPLVIVACGDTKAAPKWHVVDVSIAVENMVLAATGEGLGTCWIGSFCEDQVKELLQIPDHLKVVVLLAVGYPREKLDRTKKLLSLVRKRKTISDITSSEKYGQHYQK